MKVIIIFLVVAFVPGVLLAQDVTPPPAPIGLASTPASWTNVNSFSIDWTNPSDPSGISTTYWYKLGSAPTSNADGTTTTSKPFLATGVNGIRSVYVWLQDAAGNRSYLNYATTDLYYDGVAPSAGSININNGAAATATLIVTLTNISTGDVTSGIEGMQFSNDNSTWSPSETWSGTRSNWDLSQYGGNATTGSKTVYVIFHDRAGNYSAGSSHDIFYDPASPVQLSGFRAIIIAGDHVHFEWETVSEINNYGFTIESSLSGTGPFALLPGSFVGGQGTTNAVHKYSFEASVAAAHESYYRLRQIDLDGSIHYSETIQTGTTLDVAAPQTPSGFSLQQNFPNPFNPSTIIHFQLPAGGQVTLTVYDVLGREAAVLVNERREAGMHEVRFDAGGLAGGVYYYRLAANGHVASHKMLLLR